MTSLWNWLCRQLAPCPHRKLMQPRRDEIGDYQRCLGCGARLPCTVQFGSWRPENERSSLLPSVDRESRETVAHDEDQIPGRQWVNGGIVWDRIGPNGKGETI